MNGGTRSECVVLDGKALAVRCEAKLTESIRGFALRHQGRVPTLATILVGDDPSSAVYVRMKANACRRVGMHSKALVLPASASTREVCDVIDALNKDPDVHGILLQHPVRTRLLRLHSNRQGCRWRHLSWIRAHGIGTRSVWFGYPLWNHEAAD